MSDGGGLIGWLWRAAFWTVVFYVVYVFAGRPSFSPTAWRCKNAIEDGYKRMFPWADCHVTRCDLYVLPEHKDLCFLDCLKDGQRRVEPHTFVCEQAIRNLSDEALDRVPMPGAPTP